MRVQDKSIIVTGAGGGIGEGIAKRLADEGAHVIVNDINAALGEKVRRAIQAAGGRLVLRRRRHEVRRGEGAGRRRRAAPRQARRHGEQRRLDPPQPPRAGGQRRRVRQRLRDQHEEHLPGDHPCRAGVPRQQGRQLHQHRLHRRRAAAPRPDLVQRLQGRGHHHQQVARRVRAGQHPRELHQPGVQPDTGLSAEFAGGPVDDARRAKFLATIPLGRFSTALDVANRRSTWPATRPRSSRASASRWTGRRCVGRVDAPPPHNAAHG